MPRHSFAPAPAASAEERWAREPLNFPGEDFGGPPSLTDPAPAAQNIEEARARVFAAVNAEREKSGLNPLSLEPAIVDVAQAFADDMSKRGFFSHKSPEGIGVAERLRQSQIEFTWVGENIALGQSSPDEVMRMWMASEGHRANILNPIFDKIGIGRAPAPGYPGGYVWTQEFYH